MVPLKRALKQIAAPGFLGVGRMEMDMKRLTFYTVILLLLLGLTGCSGKEKSIDINDISESTLLARTNGEIQVATVEDFDKNYYNLSELQDFIEKEVGTYNKNTSTGKITVNNVEVIKKRAIMLLTYSGMDQYAAFNKVTTAYFTGGAKKIPLTLPATLVNAANKELASTQEIMQNEKYKILILTEPYHIIVDGKVKFYSENASFKDSNEIKSAAEGMTIIVFKP